MPVGLLVAGFLLAHAAIHVGFIAPPPPATADGPAWPFATDRAWLVTRLGLDPALCAGSRLVLVAVTIAGYALAALTALGVLPAAIWPAAIAIGSVASLGLLAACFHPWLAARRRHRRRPAVVMPRGRMAARGQRVGRLSHPSQTTEVPVMKVIVPLVLSLVATLIAVVAARLIARYDVRIDLKEFPGDRCDQRRSVADI